MTDFINEFLFKVLVIGEASVGKTSLIKRYVENEFSNKYKYTIGVDFALKQVEYDSRTIIRLQLWDIAGQERFGVMTHVYYKQATAAIVVFDVTSRKTFDAVQKWKTDLDLKVHLPNGEPVPAILLANKCDLSTKVVTNEELDKFAKDFGFIGWWETSAKVNKNVDSAMNGLMSSILVALNLTDEDGSTDSNSARSYKNLSVPSYSNSIYLKPPDRNQAKKPADKGCACQM